MLRSLPWRALVAAILVLNLGAGPTLLCAQEAPSELPPITVRANTRLVVVDVIVTDKKGQPLTGLKAEDFTVEENGKKQKVSVFVPPGVANQTPATPPPPGVLSNHTENVRPAGIPLVLVLDVANSAFKDQAYARAQMLKYVQEQSQSGRQMAILTLTDRLRVLQQFTSDPQVLMTAIKNFKPQEQVLQPSAGVAPTAAVADTSGARTSGSAMTESILMAQSLLSSFSNIQVGYEQERRTLVTIEALRALSRMLGGLPGRKNVVWLTAEFPFDLVPEDRNVTDAELMADLPNINQKSVGTIASGASAAQQRLMHGPEIKDAEARVASANIAIYPVDLHGLMGGMETLASVSAAHDTQLNGTGLADRALSQTSSLVATQGTMEEVAAETGGKAYTNQNDIKEGVALAAADEKGSYSLGYYPENKKWDGKYRNIKVKVAEGSSHLRYRKGYFAVDPTPGKDRNYEQDVAYALEFNAPATQVAFMAQAKSTEPGKIRVLFLVDAHTLTAEDSGGKMKMNVNFYASVYDAKGKNLGTRTTKVDNAFDAATYKQIIEKGMMVPIDMDVPSGGTELRLAVLDNKTGLIGTVTGPLGQ
jgi:VWFA-related protein